MTEWKRKVQIPSSSQSSIAVMKNFLADGRLTSSPPLPPTMHTPPGAPTTTPIVAYTLFLYLLGRSVGEGAGGRGAELVKPPNLILTQSLRLTYTCGKRAEYSLSSVFTLFHSVIYNSVNFSNFHHLPC